MDGQNLFNLTSFLTKRDEWAGSLHELLTEDAPRTDSPMHLPTSPTPKIPFGPNWPPPPPLRRGLETAEEQEEGSPDPQHCGRVAPHNGCPGVTAINTKQRNTITLLSRLTVTPERWCATTGKVGMEMLLGKTAEQEQPEVPAKPPPTIAQVSTLSPKHHSKITHHIYHGEGPATTLGLVPRQALCERYQAFHRGSPHPHTLVACHTS